MGPTASLGVLEKRKIYFPYRNSNPESSIPQPSHYRGADKSLARNDWKKKLKVRQFSSDAEVIAVAEIRLDGQLSELFF